MREPHPGRIRSGLLRVRDRSRPRALVEGVEGVAARGGWARVETELGGDRPWQRRVGCAGPRLQLRGVDFRYRAEIRTWSAGCRRLPTGLCPDCTELSPRVALKRP